MDRATKRTYNWESSFESWNTGTLKLKEVRALVTFALDAYKLPPIPVRSHPDKSMSFYLACDSSPMISFNKTHHNEAIALHEAAHHICDSYFGRDLPEHCPQWLGIYLWLLTKRGVAPRTALEASAKAMGLEWAARMSPGYVTKRTLCHT